MSRQPSTMKLPVPPTLDAEQKRVWVGWGMIGDQEVAREAATKGQFISLAIEFLAARKKWNSADADIWFKNEILEWVYQLLKRRQVYKATHILHNIDIDPAERLTTIMVQELDKDLRDYIAVHLIKIGKLENSLVETWSFLRLLENTAIPIGLTQAELSQLSVLKIDQCNRRWKSEIATILFFETYEPNLENLLSPELAWSYLLKKEMYDVLKLWINVYHSQNMDYDTPISINADKMQKIKSLFLLWPITPPMIKDAQMKSDTLKDFILNELCAYGIFADEERGDIRLVISRFQQTNNLQNMCKTLRETSSTLSESEFFENFVQFCIENDLYDVLNTTTQKINCKQYDLWNHMKESLESISDDAVLYKNIIMIARYLADDELCEYLQRNPLILLAIIVFSGEATLHSILMDKKSITFDDITMEPNAIVESLNRFQFLQKIYMKITSGDVKSKITLYDLINDHTTISKLFAFRSNDKLPHFSDHSLRTNDSTTSLGYLFYTRHKRPTIAAKLFLTEQLHRHQQVNEIEQFEAVKKIQELALRHFMQKDVTASCISCIEMLGGSSNHLRVMITALNTIDGSSARKYALNIEDNASNIYSDLQQKLINEFDASTISSTFHQMIKSYNLVFWFALMNDLELSDSFLVFCAKHNLWLQFLVFAQVNNYAMEQTLKLLVHFQCENIKDHLYHALSSNIRISDGTNVTKKFDMMSSFSSMSASVMSQFSLDFTHFEVSHDDTNFLKVLIKCHKDSDPPTALLHACQLYRNPLFAILATCYEPDSVMINWLTWLSISSEIHIESLDTYCFSPTTITTLLEDVLRRGYVRTALESFQIFMPDNPLCLLMKFLHKSKSLDFNASLRHLKTFEDAVANLKYNLQIIENDYELTFLHNGYWIVDTAIKFIFITLEYGFQSKEHQIIFLNTLCTADFTKNIPIQTPNFCAIAKLLRRLSGASASLDLSVFSRDDDRKKEIVRCVEQLVAAKQFTFALDLALYEGVCVDFVLTEEWAHKFVGRSQSFWIDCDNTFVATNISPSAAAQFYVNCCKQLDSYPEKYQSLKLSYKWLKLTGYSDSFTEPIEHDIWANYFALDDATLRSSCYDKNETNYLLSELQEALTLNSKCNNLLTDDQLRHLDETIDKILESGDIIEALRLEKMFGHKSVELSILMTCYQLAESKLSPYEISAEQRMLFLNREMNLKAFSHRRRTFKSTRNSNVSSGSLVSSLTLSPSVEPEDNITQDSLSLLETMIDRLKHGANIGRRILLCFRISVNTQKSYQEIIKCEDSLSFLKNALVHNCENKLDVVHDVMTVYKWNKKQIANFISQQLLVATKRSISDNLECIKMWDLNLDTNFHQVLQLCNDFSSLLGEKLVKLICVCQSDDTDCREDVSVLIELLIRAHECFTTDCNIEGISVVLRKAQTITSSLTNMKNWRSMVRLLTGIGRYNEMNYIFEILKENEQFEYLLRKNLQQDNHLKAALLKFLRKQCPKRQDLYKMVALHFRLLSEVGELWENEAADLVNNLLEIAKLEMQNRGMSVTEKTSVLLWNNDSTTGCLNKAISFYSLAAEYHLFGEKLIASMRSAKEGELLALQLAMLKNVQVDAGCKSVLRLTQNEIGETCKELSFPQAKILISSYNFPADWGAILFQQCIVQCNMTYLEDYVLSMPLSTTLVQDLIRQFLAEKISAPSSVKMMKEIVKRLDSVQMKYRLASELGFSDVIETLLFGSQLDYLKDTVWKKGYRQQL